MSICPWCKGKMPSANDVCPLCGKSPQEHPSIAAGGYGTFEAFDDFEDAGGLDVAGSVEPLTAQEGPDVFGGDALEAVGAPIKLEVEVAPIRQPARPPVQAPAPAVEAPPPPTDYRESAAAVAPARPAFDPYEIAVLADFGPAPDRVWEFPSYALRVTNRRRELGRRLGMVRRSVEEAQARRDDQLADLAERLRPALEASKELSGLLASLRQVEETAASRNEALSARNQELREKLSVVDREIDGQSKQQEEAQARVDVAAKQLDEARGRFERANAACKRAEIELRNAQEVARAAAGPQARTAPPEHAAKLQSLSLVLEERRAAMREPQSAFDAAKRSWNDADSALKLVQRRIAELQKQRRGIEQSYAKELNMRSAGVQQAQSERRAAYVAVGAQLIEMNAAIVPREQRQAFFEAQEILVARQLEAERLNQAIVSADPQAVKKGWIVLGAGAALGLLLLAALIAAFGRSEPDPEYGGIAAPTPARVSSRSATACPNSRRPIADANAVARRSCDAPAFRA